MAYLPPSAPTIVFPKPNTTIYNLRPRIGLRINSDPQGFGQKATLTIPGWSSINTDTTTSFSRTGSLFLVSGDQIFAKWPYDLGLFQYYGFQAITTNLASLDSGISYVGMIYVQTAFFTDSIIAYERKIKAVHINQLRTAINNVRAYYGLAAVAWTDNPIIPFDPANPDAPCTYIKTATHFNEMRNAIMEIINYVNGFDPAATNQNIKINSSNLFTDTLTDDDVPPKAVYVTELRNLIPLL